MSNGLSANGAPAFLRLRAALLLLATVSIFAVSAGRFLSVSLGLGWGWSLVVVLACVAVVAFVIWRLTRKWYLILGAAITLLITYLTYDFLSGALGLSSGTAMLVSIVPFLVVAAAFWDFLRLKEEVRLWMNSR